jgi:hypothetical protein
MSSTNISSIDSLIGPLILEGNLAKNWTIWLQRFKIFLTASNLESEKDERKIAILLHNLGEKCFEIFNSFNLDSSSASNYDTVVGKFEAYFSPKKNLTVERHKFLTRKQNLDESFDSFCTDLVNKSLNCEFDKLREDLVRDVLICGLNSNNQHIKERLLRESDLTLDKAVNICKAAELSSAQIKELEGTEIAQVGLRRTDKARTSTSYHQPQQQAGKQKKWIPKKFITGCTNCGKDHLLNQCPAFGVECFNCKRKNHFSSFCTARPNANNSGTRPKPNFVQYGKNKHKKVNEVGLSNPNVNNDSLVVDSLNFENFSVDTVNQTLSNRPTDWLETVVINNHNVSFKLDSGAQTNLLSYSMFKELGLSQSQIVQSNVVISSFTGQQVPIVGRCNINCLIRSQNHDISFVIVDAKCSPLLGLETCCKLGLISRSVNSLTIETDNIVVKDYQIMFDGNLGTIPGEIKLELSSNYEAKIEPPRRVPFALMEPLKNELDRMEKLGIVAKVNEPTEWVHGMVLINKKGSGLRVVLDPRNLNKYLKRPQCQIPTAEEIGSKLTNSKLYSVLDASSAFWMFKLDENSSRLCTFNTPFARYRFLRMPYGISSAPDHFQSKMNELFGSIDGVVCYFDDICISGIDQKTHDERLRKVLEIAKVNGIKFNLAKCKFRVPKVKFVGLEYSEFGVSPDTSKVLAIQEMPAPADRKELERFLGVTNYLAKFIPNYSTVTTPLRELLRKDVVFRWDHSQEKAFQKLKELLASPPVLCYFDHKKDVTLSVDSSSTGLGAVLLCGNNPVAYASRSLTQSQINYSQIEKEMCAIAFGCTRFHQYIFSRKITVETDHKPLVSLFKKPLSQAPLRLQTMLLKVQRYDLEVIYKPGKLLFIADTLSRSSLPCKSIEEIDLTDDDIICQVTLFKDSLPISKEKLCLFKSETDKDSTLVKVRHFVKTNWPINKNTLENCLKPFWNLREDLHVIDSLLYKNDRLVVPHNLQKDMLVKLHDGHVGATTCGKRAKNVLFWPGINADITEFVNNCKTCTLHTPNNSKEPIIFHDIPCLPWSKISADLFELKSIQYLVLMDYYSKYIELVSLNNISSKTVIKKMKSIFARHGVPQILVTDPGTQFTSKEFEMFASVYEFSHVTTSPKHSQSNGQIESGVKIAKGILKKCQHSNTDPYIALLNYRNTPKVNLPSPAQLLFSRNLNSLLPCSTEYLEPKVTKPNLAFVERRKLSVQKYYDRNAKPLSQLNVNDQVLFKKTQDSPWFHGKIKALGGTPRSYLVQDENGRLFKRNRKFFISSPSQDIDNDVCQDTNNSHCSPVTGILNPATPNRSLNICQPSPSHSPSDLSETNVIKNMEGYVTSRGRVIKNPKRLSYECN